MLSNFDLNRIKNESSETRSENKKIYFESEANYSLIFKSAAFSKYMQKVLSSYESGAASIRFPFMASIPFLNAVLSKFRSYNMTYLLYPDYNKRRFIFVKL